MNKQIPALLEASSLSYKVDDRHLIYQVGLELNTGEFLAVIGLNGAGKSTLLRLLTGELKPSSGTVQFHGEDLQEIHPRLMARRRAVLSQHIHLSFAFSVLEVVLLGRIPHQNNRQDSAEDLDIAQKCLDRVGLGAFSDRNYLNLSGGEQQRVQLARALAQIESSEKNRLLFLDEPTSSLDISHQHKVLQIAKNLCLEHGVGVFAVLHDINLASQYADRVLVLDGGRKIAIGKTDDILNEKTLRTAFRHDMIVTKHPTRDCKLVIT